MKTLILVFLLTAVAHATLPSTLVLEVRAAGSDTNGGGFVAGGSGTDYSQNNNKNATGCTSCGSSTVNLSKTDAVAAGTTTLISATANFSAAIVDNLIYLQGGTGSLTAVWRRVTGFTNSTTITLDDTVAVGTGITINIGGALGSPGQAGAIEVAGNTVWFKGSFTLTSATVNVSGGLLKDTVGGIDGTQPLHWEGYGSTRGDKVHSTFTLQNGLTSSSIWIVDYAGGSLKYTYLDSIDVDAGTGNTTANGIRLSTNQQYLTRSKISNTTRIGLCMTDQYEYAADVEVTGFSGLAGVRVDATDCGTGGGGDLTSTLTRATIHDGSAPGINSYTGMLSFSNILIYNISNGGTGTVPGAGMIVDYFSKITNATVYGAATDGIYLIGRGGGYLLGLVFTNVLVYGSGAFGWKTEENEGIIRVRLINCAGGNNTSGNYDSGITSVNLESFVALSANPFVSSAGSNFNLNTTAGGGAALRGAGTPGAMGSTTTGYASIGAVIPQSTSGGGQTAHAAQ